jgi:hypothetical protein
MNSSAPRTDRRQLTAFIVLIDILIALFPPLYWWAGNGQAVPALTYFIGGGAFITASLFVLSSMDDSLMNDRARER